MDDQRKNIVIIGDGYVGKTSILNAIKKEKFEDHIPNVYEDFELSSTINGKQYKLRFIDTAGQEEYAMIRKLSYKEANVFLLCFAVDDRVSFENMQTKWLLDLNEYEHIPIVLTGTKCDLRDSHAQCITRGEIIRFQKKIGALFYVECSAKTQDGIQDLIKKLFRYFSKERSCVLQ